MTDNNQKTKLCKYITKKNPFHNVETCNYAHNIQELKTQDCHFKSNCRYIKTCKYFHPSIETKQDYILKILSTTDNSVKTLHNIKQDTIITSQDLVFEALKLSIEKGNKIINIQII